MKISNPPNASDLMETARSFGNYDLSAALADLIDNSIKARAKKVSVDFEPTGNDVVVRITDDGSGMTAEELIQAMRPASSNPNEKRDADDLGRFGWGLKSASFSQARVLTVVTWKKNSICSAQWNLDDIEDWGMDFLEGDDAKKLLLLEPATKSGTEVIWRSCARFSDGLDDIRLELDDLIDTARTSLALTFHRYLSGEEGRRLEIDLNSNPVDPLDPFFEKHPATQRIEAEKIRMKGLGSLTVQPYILPHFSKLDPKEIEMLDGGEGMIRNQGFYVYRNRRLIIHGTWFRLLHHNELSQLTRVKVDLPNSMDQQWHITLDKSGAQLPANLKQHLRKIVSKFNRRSISVQRKKGVPLKFSNSVPVWERMLRKGVVSYKLNRDHPILAAVGKLSSGDESFRLALKIIESSFPVENFLRDGGAGDKSVINQALTSPDEFEYLVDQAAIQYLANRKSESSEKDFMVYLKSMEPFASHWTFVEGTVGEIWNKKWSELSEF